MIAVVLAAGLAKRFGSAKQVAPIDGQPMICRVLDNLPQLKTRGVVVGAHAEKVCSALADYDVTLLANPDFSSGISSSIKVAAKHALAKGDGLFLTLADLPYVTRMDYQKLLDSFDGSTVFSSFEGHIGPPCIFPNDELAKLTKLSGDRGAKALFPQARTVTISNAARDVDWRP